MAQTGSLGSVGLAQKACSQTCSRETISEAKGGALTSTSKVSEQRRIVQLSKELATQDDDIPKFQSLPM